MTLLITLGFLAVLFLLTMSFAISSRTERKASAVNADFIRTRLLAESALDRVLASIENEFQGDVYPGSKFYRPASGVWSGRSYLASLNGDVKSDIATALESKFQNVSFTPSGELDPNVGWTLVKSKRNINGTDVNAIIGRYAYVVIDESGKIDPSAVVSATATEDTGAAKAGASVTDVQLADAGVADANAFRPAPDGQMPANGRWFSMSHIVKALNPNQAQMDAMVQTLHPYSSDEEKFWRDTNNNGHWDEGEDQDRINLAGTLSLSELYSLFCGPNKNLLDDDCAWLKQVDNNPWVATWRAATGATQVQARQRIAAQVACNLLDYADADSTPTPANVNPVGELVSGTTDAVGCYSIMGVERTWGVTEMAMRVQAHVVMQVPPPSAEGDLNINPQNNEDQFTLTKPTGNITRDTLMNEGSGFSYTGSAQSVYLKVKAQGRTLLINGKEVNLIPNNHYLISSPHMTVNLRNLNPGGKNWAQAMGHWWISIQAEPVTITPDPGIPPADPEPYALQITPGFKGEIYFPFATGADSSDPPGTLSVSYKIQVTSETGVVGVADTSIDVALTGSRSAEGGTLVYSTDYTNGEVIEVAPAFDTTCTPPKDSYTVSLAQISAVTLRDPAGNVVDVLPVAAMGEFGRYLCNWTQNGSTNADVSLFASMRCNDPMQNGRGEVDSDFLDVWAVFPNANMLGGTDQSDVSNYNGLGYGSMDYCDVQVKNAPFVRVGELGRVHSFQPQRSLRLWSQNAAEEVGHDAEILDLFKIGADSQRRGKVNINTLQAPVLRALFTNATVADATTAANAVLAKRQAGTKFTNIGQLFGGVSMLCAGATLPQDDVAEAAVTKLAELVTVRPNYFTVLICAQGVKDVAGPQYDSDGNGVPDKSAAYNQFDVKLDALGNVVQYVDQVVAEQKVMAVLYRDGFSNRLRVERFEYLNE
ncbi:MAG: hypothetical protein A3K19_24210 [Lentisphaerae bacterium RIFOXYB12_FULL_65_16]|nr:MAG: hypothetical protein A3K18_32505 [Lentisphaerae bacterium RIFOXYA12_64_32]OGV87602.1 MAG: hypothetical protein A3K19_24210 [Lentisphaerae bacterium RIFOXYB12_FULL_65_16]